MDIQKIDRNFAVKDFIRREHTAIFDAARAPFALYGLTPPQYPGDLFRRMPAGIAAAVSPGVEALHANCAGGRVRFCTDSPYIAIAAEFGSIGKMPHFALTGSAGFDLYSGSRHIASFQPQFNIESQLFGETYPDCQGLCEYTLHLPLYSELKSLHIILDDRAALEPAAPYRTETPVVFYGSSITQGGCASRPGTCYSAIVSRRLDCDHINLGFSGSAKGETAMAEYIAGLTMSALVYDYDHNAPTPEHLQQTHQPFFEIIRKAHPQLPILCLNRPFGSAEVAQRSAIIQNTVDRARAAGDRNVYYLDINTWLKERGIAEEATVDRCHPNDLGFFYMAQAVEETLANLLLRGSYDY